jgi:hypothetical protein
LSSDAASDVVMLHPSKESFSITQAEGWNTGHSLAAMPLDM